MLTVLVLWIKQVFAGLAVQTVWFEQSLWQWAAEHTAMFVSALGGALALTAWTVLLRRAAQRIALLLLNAALMEANGITAQISTDPGQSDVSSLSSRRSYGHLDSG